MAATRGRKALSFGEFSSEVRALPEGKNLFLDEVYQMWLAYSIAWTRLNGSR